MLFNLEKNNLLKIRKLIIVKNIQEYEKLLIYMYYIERYKLL